MSTSALHRKLVRDVAARGANACVVIAAIMVLIAASYVVFAALDLKAARVVVVPYSVLELVLSVWNLMVYREKSKQRGEL